MSKENRVLMVDVGSDTLKLAEFVFTPAGEIILEKFAFAGLEEDEGGGTLNSFAEKYRQLLVENKFSARKVRISISGQASFARLSKLPPVSGGAGVQKVVEFEARQSIPYAMDEVVWAHQEIKRIVKGEEVIEGAPGEEPTRIETETEEYETLIVAVKSDQLSAYCEVVISCGQKILSVEVAPIALFNASRAVQTDDRPTLLLNIGGRSSSLVISDGGRIFVRTIPIGGDMITQQIARDFSVSMAEAEDLKRRHGSVALGGAYEEPESELAATISKIARNVMTRLHGEVSRSLNVWRSQHGGNFPQRLLLSGGGSMLQYVVEFFKEKLHIPVDYFSAFPLISLSSSIDKEKLLDVAPMFPELIGMTLHDVARCPVDIILLPDFLRKQELLRKKAPYFYAGAISAIVCLSVFLVGAYKLREYNEKLVAGVEKEVVATERMSENVRRENSELNGIKEAYDTARSKFTSRNHWARVMEDLQKRMPDTMFLVALEGLGDQVEIKQDNSDDYSGGLFDAPSSDSEPKEEAAVFVPVEAEKIQEIKELRLKGYSLILTRDLLEREFRANLQDSPFFGNGDSDFVIEEKYFIPGRGRNNLTSFVIRLKLKDSIKK